MEYSLTCPATAHSWYTMCLNPYSNGILTDAEHTPKVLVNGNVLILILMEYSQTTWKLSLHGSMTS